MGLGQTPSQNRTMNPAPRILTLIPALLLAACTSFAPSVPAARTSPCAVSEAAMACQVERYNNVNAD